MVRPAGAAPAVQFDLAVAPPDPQAQAPALTAAQLAAAIRFNTHRMADPYVFAVIRDVMGASRFPAVVDADFVQAIARWQAMFGLPVDGRLTEPTVATVVRELRAESALVPSLADDANRVELEAALTFDQALLVDAATIRTIQGIIGAPATGVWDDATVRAVDGLPDGARPAPRTAWSARPPCAWLINDLIAAARFDDAIHVIVDYHHFPTANLAIRFDATVAGADALTDGVIGTGNLQTVRGWGRPPSRPGTTHDPDHRARVAARAAALGGDADSQPARARIPRLRLGIAGHQRTGADRRRAGQPRQHRHHALERRTGRGPHTPPGGTGSWLDLLIAAGGVGNF